MNRQTTKYAAGIILKIVVFGRCSSKIHSTWASLFDEDGYPHHTDWGQCRDEYDQNRVD